MDRTTTSPSDWPRPSSLSLSSTWTCRTPAALLTTTLSVYPSPSKSSITTRQLSVSPPSSSLAGITEVTEVTEVRAMARDMEDQVEAGRVRAITTEYKTVTR